MGKSARGDDTVVAENHEGQGIHEGTHVGQGVNEAQEINEGHEGGYGDYLASLIARKNNNFAAASDYMHRSYRKGHKAAPLKKAYISALEAGRMERAEKLAPLLAGKVADPEDYWIDLQRGVAALRDLDYGQAQKYFATAAQTPGLARAAVAGLLEVWTVFGMGDHEKARLLVTDLPPRQKEHAAALYGLHHALLLAAGEKREEARRVMAQYIAEFPASMPFAVHINGLLSSDDGVADEQAPNKKISTEQAYIEPVTNALQGGAAVLLHAAHIAQIRSRCEEGLRYAWLAEQLIEDFSPAAIERGNCYGILGDGQAAITAYGSIPDSHALSKMARLALAKSYQNVGKSDQALGKLQGLMRDYPDDPHVMIYLGDQLRYMGRYDEAVKIYDRVDADEDPESVWPLHYARAVALARSGDGARSEEDLQTALSLRPDDPYIINHLAYSWIERGIRLDDAQDMLEKALERLPNNGHIIDSYGWVLFQRGDFFQAVLYLERAAEILPMEAAINHHLGDALAKVGRGREARYHWQRALGQTPAAVEKTTLRRKLDGQL